MLLPPGMRPLLVIVLVCASAHADPPAPAELATYRPTSYGLAVILGGGVTGYTDHALRSATDAVGGLWSLRATFGTHVPLAIEAAYVGSATGLESLVGNAHTTLIGTTFETDVRLNLAPHLAWDPYVFAGVGWSRFTVDDRDLDFSDTGIRSGDSVMELPFGGGLAFRRGGLITDVRGTVRATSGSDMVIDREGRAAPMHSWEASAALGYEF
jgi:hypothetical protein